MCDNMVLKFYRTTHTLEGGGAVCSVLYLQKHCERRGSSQKYIQLAEFCRYFIKAVPADEGGTNRLFS